MTIKRKLLLVLLAFSIVLVFANVNKNNQENGKVTVTKYEIPALDSMSAKEWMEILYS